MSMSKEQFDSLVKLYQEEFKSLYATTDRAHGVDHFKRVFQCGVQLNNSLPSKVRFEEELIFVVAYTHDLFTGVCRERHHTLAGEYVRNNAQLFFRQFDSTEIELIALACEQHRASFKGEFSNLFCELMNSADRELPKTAKDILSRAIMYREDNYPDETKEEVMAESIKHVKEKFGHGGYARYPELYERSFKKELQSIRDEIDRL